MSQETRCFIHELIIDENLNAAEVFLRRFRDDTRVIALKHLRKLEIMFRDPNRTAETASYLGSGRKRGNQGSQVGTTEMDIYMQRILQKFPHATLDFYRVQMAEIRGYAEREYSYYSMRASIWRCKATRKRTSFYSGLQDTVRIIAHMDAMRATHPDKIVCIDETSCSSEKRRPITGRGQGEVIIHEWNIDNVYYSAMAAMTTRGFMNWNVKAGVFTHEDVETFIESLSYLITDGDCCLFDNASIHVVDSTLTVIDRIFNHNWKRNVEYCPHLNPIEKGFSMIWNYVRSHWLDAQRNPVIVLNNAFRYYSIGGPCGKNCEGLFNVYARYR